MSKKSPAPCSPSHYINFQNSGTCYSFSDLKLIRDVYNEQNQANPISKAKFRTKQTLYEELRRRFEGKCGEIESCWIDTINIAYNKKKELEESFRPKKPREWYNNRRTWLNTYDILYVMEQYEKKYKNFKFLGVYPIDFNARNSSGSCIGNIMCSLHVRDLLNQKKKRFGIVVNTDPHNRGGQHWFSIYFNIDPKIKNFGIYYYDSVAYPPEKEMTAFMEQIKSQIYEVYPEHIAKKFEVKHNTERRQYKNTECGVFSIIFLTQCLKNIPCTDICKRMFTDDQINAFRDSLYRESQYSQP